MKVTPPQTISGKDYTRLFKTGDAVDLQLGAGRENDRDQKRLMEGDLRIVFPILAGEPAAVLMKPVDSAALSDKKESCLAVLKVEI